jgi:ABC-type uncharacterized transport system substrate-binding protein
LAILANVGFAESVLEMGEVEAAARKLGIEVVAKLEIERAEDIAPAFDALQGRAYATQQRTPKLSASLYREVAARNRLV